MSMEYEEAKKKIVEGLTKKLKTKSKFYFNDLSKILEMKPREAKKIVNKLVEDGTLRVLVQRQHLYVRHAGHWQASPQRRRRLGLRHRNVETGSTKGA